jgi:hypothetical protein
VLTYSTGTREPSRRRQRLPVVRGASPSASAAVAGQVPGASGEPSGCVGRSTASRDFPQSASEAYPSIRAAAGLTTVTVPSTSRPRMPSPAECSSSSAWARAASFSRQWTTLATLAARTKTPWMAAHFQGFAQASA